MNRSATRTAEMELARSAEWCAINRRCFEEIFIESPQGRLNGDHAFLFYLGWQRDRGNWCSRSLFLAQLRRNGYTVTDGSIEGIALRPEGADVFRMPRAGQLTIQAAANRAGVPAGLLKLLRKCGGGPDFSVMRKGIFYEREVLDCWLLGMKAVTGSAELARDVRLCLAAICEFAKIESRRTLSHYWAARGAGVTDPEVRTHPRLIRSRTDRQEWAELLAASAEWFKRERGAAPPSLSKVLTRQLKALGCKRIHARKPGGRVWMISGLWLKESWISNRTDAA